MSRTVVLLHDEEREVDLGPLAGWQVVSAAVSGLPEVWGESDVYGAPASAGGARRLASKVALRAGRMLRTSDRVLLLPRDRMTGQVPTTRHWMSAALVQVDALRARAKEPLAVVVVGTRSELIGWHLGNKHPDVLVVAGTAAAPSLVEGGPLGVPFENLRSLLIDPEVLLQAVPDLLAEEPVEVVRETADAPCVRLSGPGDAVLLSLPVAAADPSPVLDGRMPPPAAFPVPRTGLPRLLVGAANFSGQAAAWTRTATGLDARCVAVVPTGSRYVFPADVMVSGAEWTDAAVRARIAAREIVPATHVLAESMRPVAGLGWPGRIHPASIETAACELEALLDSGRTVGVVLHGSEARTPARHRATYPFSPFDDPSAAVEWAKREEQSAKIHAVLDRLPVRRFVTTPDMLDFVDDATWLPLAIGAGAFRAGRPLFSRERPVFLHAPSAGPVKGSAYVDAVLGPLHDEGVLEYRLLSGVAPWELPAHLRDADVVIDQLMLGGSGVLAVQAMAAGRLVLGHVAEHVRARYAEPLPILEADPTTLREVVLGIIADREAAAAAASAGPAFARAWHDGSRSAAVLREFVGV